MSRTLLLTISSVFLIFMVLNCNNPTTNDDGFDWDTGSVTDIEGNTYMTIKIGNQEWMAENLRTTKYNDGTEIPHVTDSITWADLTTPAYCYYKNMTNADSIRKFGVLYDWYVVETGKLAPEGWHVPDTMEWYILENYLVANGYNWDGTTDTNEYNKIAKSLAAQTDWKTDSKPGAIGNKLAKNNRSGFSALPGGYRFFTGRFEDMGYIGDWWSTTELGPPDAFTYYLVNNFDNLNNGGTYKNGGVSVRLVRD